jgi:hypothetical protein
MPVARGNRTSELRAVVQMLSRRRPAEVELRGRQRRFSVERRHMQLAPKVLEASGRDSLDSAQFNTCEDIGVVCRLLTERSGLGSDQLIPMQDLIVQMAFRRMGLRNDSVHEGL